MISSLELILENFGYIYYNSENIDELFKCILKTLTDTLKADFALMYLEDESVLSDINHSTSLDSINAVFSNQYVLAASYFSGKTYNVAATIPSQDLILERTKKLSNSVFLQRIMPSIILSSEHHNAEQFNLILFDSPKIKLCQALFIINFIDKDFSLNNDLERTFGKYFDYIIPFIESVYRRQIDKLTRIVFSSGERSFAVRPGYLFHNLFRELCDSLSIEGSSLIVKGLPSADHSLQLVATFPKQLPQDRSVYRKFRYSLTQWIFSLGKDCVIPSAANLRSTLN
jgi:hypothetical protein